MKKNEIRQMKSRIQRLETLIADFQDDVEMLHDNSVDVSQKQEIAERQEELQGEMEQAASDLLALLDTSGAVDRDSGYRIDLPNTGRRPVSAGKLPEPSTGRPEGRGPPAWSNGGGNGKGSGNGKGN